MNPRYDLGAGVFLFIVSVLIFWASFGIRMLTVSRIGSAFIPQIVAVGMGIFSLVLVYRAFRVLKSTKTTPETEAKIDRFRMLIGNLPVIGTFVVLVLYAALLEPLGFVVSTMGYLFFQIILLSGTRKRRYPIIVIISVLAPFIIYYLFVWGFQLMLPPGFLG